MSPPEKTNDAVAAVAAIAEPVCLAHGVELVQVQQTREHGSVVLRVLIDCEGSEKGPGFGVSVGDCQAVSRDLAPALEVHDALPGKYRLEVSSPGVDRPLVRLRDFERFTGSDVSVRTHEPVEVGNTGPRRKLQGALRGVEGERVLVEVDGVQLALAHQDIAKANVVYRFDT